MHHHIYTYIYQILKDPRLPGGYENVPTVDIHMKQVNWEKHWLYFLKKFVQLMQRKIFIGYFHDVIE